MKKKFLVTGGCGFLGSNLGAEVLRRGHELVVIDNLARVGTPKNLDWLRAQGKFEFHQMSVSDRGGVDRVIGEYQPDVLFHLAGQVAMTTSISNPRLDFETNVVGSINVLEA